MFRPEAILTMLDSRSFGSVWFWVLLALAWTLAGRRVAGVPVDEVQLDKSFVEDLDVDSLAMVEIIVGCEEKFGVTIPDEDSKNLKTVGDAVAYIESHQ